MVAIVFIMAGIWFFFAFNTPLPESQIIFAAMGFGFIVAYYVPLLIKHFHVLRQNRLIDRCRALFILGAGSLEEGATDRAKQALLRIRRLERVWKIGDAPWFKTSLAIWAILCGIAICIGLRFASIIVSDIIKGTHSLTPASIMSELSVAGILSLSSPIYALTGFFDAWGNPWAIENCGDRLSSLIFGPRSVEPATERAGGDIPSFDGMTPREVFGLGPRYTRRQLDQARRALVRELHPDRWGNRSEMERKNREEALKRVNAAYDVLLKEIT